MTVIEIVTGLDEAAVEPAVYQLAEQIILTDVRLPVLQPYTVKYAPGWSKTAAPSPELQLSDSTIYTGVGWIANSWRKVECLRTQDGYQLRIVDLASFWIDDEGQSVIMIEVEGNNPHELLMQAAIGAPFLLALALRGVFLLHVSLVRMGEHYLAFAGESGEGKSTMARYLGLEGGNSWQRIVDDMLPVRLQSGKVEALPHFPQLKLRDDIQPVHFAPPRVSVSVLYVLSDKSHVVDKRIEIAPLRRRMATLAVIQHTIAARLFGRQLLADHLAFCDSFSASVPVRSLKYPRRFEQLPLVRDAIEEDLACIV